MTVARKATEDEGSEFADFLADVSQEIAQRVQSLQPPPDAARVEQKKEPAKPDPGVIADWEDVTDRLIEEMR